MKLNVTLRIAVIVSAMCISAQSWSLNVKEFQQYCAAPNSESVFCQSYLGGALDAIAVMNDEAKRQGYSLYCEHERQVFDMKKMLNFKLSQPEKNHAKNAIYPLLEYLKVNGQCDKAQSSD